MNLREKFTPEALMPFFGLHPNHVLTRNHSYKLIQRDILGGYYYYESFPILRLISLTYPAEETYSEPCFYQF